MMERRTGRTYRVLARAAWIAALLGLSASPADAGRPLDTEDTGTIEVGHVEVELSSDWTRSEGEDVWSPKAVLGAGILPGLELRIEGTHLTREPEGEPSEQGFGDTVFGIKYRLLDERPNFPAVLAGLTLRLPTGDDERGLGEEEFDVGGLVAVSKTFGPLAAILNAGYTFATLGRTFDAWTVNAALEYRVTAAWSLVAEVVQEFPNSDDPHTVVVRGGTVYAVTDRIKLDAGVGVGATRASPDVVVTAGITISF